MRRRSFLVLAALIPLALSGCGDTWRGFKKDTGENLGKAGRAIERAGEKVKK